MATSGTNIDFQTFSSDQAWLQASTQFIVQSIQSQLSKGGKFRLALSGGSTPKPVYKNLVDQNIPFSQIDLFQVDERYVPAESSDLNASMLRETLSLDVNQFHASYFFDTSIPLVESVQAYERALVKMSQPLFHLTILGIGPDGHTASLFPNSSALRSEFLVATTTTDIFAGRERLTLTPKALMASETVLILAKGREKEAVIKAFVDGSQSIGDLPITCVRQHPNLHFFYQNS